MFGSKRKEFGLSGLCLALLALLLIISGCDTTSDPIQSFEATGSWQGTIGADRVQGIVAPDGRYHLAIVDANGDFIPGAGEYIGKMILVDRENSIGRMSMTYLHPSDNAEFTEATFKVGASLLYSEDAPIALNRTGDAASGLYTQAAVEGHWSLTLSDTDNLTAAVIDAAGNLHGNDNDACQYSGTLQLMDSTWNIFQLDLTFSNLPGKDCRAPSSPYRYSGLAMPLTPEGSRRRIWLAANVWETSLNRTDTYFGNWAETVNVKPVAKMTANGVELQEPPFVQPLEVKKIAKIVELGAQGSFDANKDTLTYHWRGSGPGDAELTVQATAAGSATFTPAQEGVYTLWLKVNDGLLDSVEIERRVQVKWAPNPFVDCKNGTVLATERIGVDAPYYLLWLKDAGCAQLNDPDPNTPEDLWGVKVTLAQERVAVLTTGFCGLADGSIVGAWRLPLRSEFAQIIYPGQFPAPPQLLNSTGENQWTEGDAFFHVGVNNDLVQPFYRYQYWTDEPVVGTFNWYYADFNYALPQYMIDNKNFLEPASVWPVRTASEAEVAACLQP